MLYIDDDPIIGESLTDDELFERIVEWYDNLPEDQKDPVQSSPRTWGCF